MLGGWPLVGSSKARTPRATESSTLEGQAQNMYNTKCTKSYKDIQSMTCPNCPHCVLFVTHLLHTCETTKGTDCPRQTISSKSRQQQSAGVHRPKFHGICDHRLWSWPLPGNHFSVRAWQISRLGCRECSVERPQDQVCLWSSEHALDRAKNELTCKGVPKCVLQAFPTYNTMNCSCLTRLLSSIAQKENQGTLEHHQKQNNIFQIDFRRRLLTYFATGVRHSQRHGLF